jgi:hypothetical protein
MTSTVYAVEEAKDITGGAIAILTLADPFGSIGEWDSEARLTSRGEFRFRVRVRNLSGDPVEGDSLIVVVHQVQSADYLHDATDQLEFVGAEGQTQDGKPFYRVPLGGKAELGPYAESEEFPLEIRNPNLLIIYTPILRVHGVRRTESERIKETLRTLTPPPPPRP